MRNGDILLETRCLTSKECLTYKLVASTTKKKKIQLTSVSHGGTSPGSLICRSYLQKKAVILKDIEGNENSFCLFEDGSLIDMNSLTNLFEI